MTELRFFEQASEEAEEARHWYGERSEQAEAAFLNDLDHALTLVLHAPERWPKYIAGTRRYVFPTFPYSLIYFREDQTIHVVAIAHGRRRPGYWRKRRHSETKLSK